MCSIDFIGNGSDWAVFSSCFPFVETSTCSNESECRISIQGIIECCCFEDDCFNGTSGLLGIAVSRGMYLCTCVCFQSYVCTCVCFQRYVHVCVSRGICVHVCVSRGTV